MKEDISRQNSNEGKVDYAYLPFASAFEVAEAIQTKCGGIVSDFKVLEGVVGVKGGALRGRVSNAKIYGLIEGRSEYQPTKLSIRIIQPTKPNEKDIATKEAIMNVPLFKKLDKRYGRKIPLKEVFFRNILVREYVIPKNKVGRVLNTIKKNLELISTLKLPEEDEPQNHEETTLEERPNTTTKKGNVLIIYFGNHKHEFEITSETDWQMIEAIINGLKKKWLESKKENSAYSNEQEGHTES